MSPTSVTGLREPSGEITLTGLDHDVVLEKRLKSKVMWSLAPVSIIHEPRAPFNIAQLI